MTHRDLSPPEFGAPMAPANPSPDAIALLALRRSTSPERLGPPGPGAGALAAILTIAARVPDHRKLAPFRFVVFENDGRARAGESLARALQASQPQADTLQIEAERRRFLRAPMVIAVVSRVDRAHKTPEWEQIMTAGAVCQNLLLAANAHGFAGCWITEWCGYDRMVLEEFGLGMEERLAGFIYLGTAKEDPRERQRPDIAALTARF